MAAGLAAGAAMGAFYAATCLLLVVPRAGELARRAVELAERLYGVDLSGSEELVGLVLLASPLIALVIGVALGALLGAFLDLASRRLGRLS